MEKTEWLFGQPPRIVRRGWPQAPSHFLAPRITDCGSRGAKRSRKATVRDGHRFEASSLEHLEQSAGRGWYFIPECKIEYKNNDMQPKCAYLDCLAINPLEGCIYVLECKRSHTASSYKQIWRYMALVKSVFGERFAVMGFEVCKFHGRSHDYPGPARWLMPGPLVAKAWDGFGLPEVSIVPWYQGKFYI